MRARWIVVATTGALLFGAGWRVWLANHQLGDLDFISRAPAAEQVDAAERVLAFPIGNHHDACLILGARGDARSIPALIGALRWLRDDGACTNFHCLDALELLTGHEANSHEEWKTWWKTVGVKLPASAFPLPEPPPPPRPPVSGPSCPSEAIQAARRSPSGNACARLDHGLGHEHTCVRRSDGTLWCWGKAIPHHLGLGRAAPPSRVAQAGSDIAQVVSSGDRTCVVERGGVLRCWTWSGHEPEPATTATGVVEAAMGQRRLCARTGDGRLSCWMLRGDAELGLGTTLRAGARRRRVRPADLIPEVDDLRDGVISASAGEAHICAARTDGSLWCWGANDDGQTGVDGKQDWVPIQVGALGTCVAEVAAGDRHTCARMVDGSVWCWGRNGVRGATSPRSEAPVQVLGVSRVEQITAGARHTCALEDDGSLWCWGLNDKGQLGDGTTIDRATPVQVTGLGAVMEVAAGASHTCARTIDDTIWCWGMNDRGQLGDGTTVDRPAPVKAFSCGP